MNLAVTTVERLFSTLVPGAGPDPIVLLGAGASIKSGIPLSWQIVERAAKWAYCISHGRNQDDLTVRRTDWLPWLHSHSWYRKDLSAADNYSAVIDNLLQPRQVRKDFFLDILDPGVPASTGYERLMGLVADNLLRTLLTTNFDSVFPDYCRASKRLHHVELIKTPDDYTKLSTSPPYPQYIYIHGSVEHYTDKNLTEEVEHLDKRLVPQLVPLLRDHPLVVIGYRGAERSVMYHLLIEQAEKTNLYRHGIFWCELQDRISGGLHPFVQELTSVVGRNLQVVPITGFDDLMNEIWSIYTERRPAPIVVSPRAQGGNPSAALAFDMRPVSGASLERNDWPLAQTKLIAYCDRTEISAPNPISREWLTERLIEQDLAVSSAGTLELTHAGYLLFARRPQERLPGARVLLRIEGSPEASFEGNLWNQLDAAMAALDEVNRPFRLKGTVSEVVYPYPRLALKELVVNALVHRNYDTTKPVVVEIEPSYVRISNPGGLIEPVWRKMGYAKQDHQEGWRRGVKGYRNSVIADLFYGAGAMDKAGSGLADVQQWVKENGGKVVFGPTANNAAFDVIIYARPEVADAVTGTASPSVATARYATNLLEVVELPMGLFSAQTRFRIVASVWEAARKAGIQDLPPFMLHGGRLYTFSNLADPKNPLRSLLRGAKPEPLSLKELAEGEDGERNLVNLLNRCLFNFLESRDLYVDRKHKRAYLPRTDTGPREVTYQARVRRATRTVTKPVISKTSGEVLYWVHEAIRFGFERYEDAWALQILPSYVFTVNGWRKLLDSPKVGKLATRHASHDYNSQVRNDLIFWASMLAGGQDPFIIDGGDGSRIVVRSGLITCEVHDWLSLPVVEEPELDAEVRAELEREDDETPDIEELLKGRLNDTPVKGRKPGGRQPMREKGRKDR